MDIFDIVGPIMVGPSSSHTAGAVRIGYIGGKLLGEPVKKAQILLYGSFLATGEGHGTKKAIVAGLLGKLILCCFLHLPMLHIPVNVLYFL